MTTVARTLPIHPQVYSAVVDAEVDEGIVEMLEWLARQGFVTESSCQGSYPNEANPDGIFAYIGLMDPDMSMVRVLKEHTKNLTVEVFHRQERKAVVMHMPPERINEILDGWRVAFGD